MSARKATRDREAILLVEDEDELRDVLTDILEDEGYDVIPASNGKQARDYLDTARPSVIILDLMLPIMNGWEYLRALRSDERFASIPVLVTTGVDRDRPPGASAILKKPYSVGELVEILGRLLGRAPAADRVSREPGHDTD
jgi:DNA-binding response OmpR family regulator